MNRRGFISMLAGAAGAPLVPWRGLIEPLIVLAVPPQLTWKHYNGYESIDIEPSVLPLVEAEFTWSEEPASAAAIEFSELVSAAFAKYRTQIIETITDESPLFRRLIGLDAVCRR